MPYVCVCYIMCNKKWVKFFLYLFERKKIGIEDDWEEERNGSWTLNLYNLGMRQNIDVRRVVFLPPRIDECKGSELF